MKTKKTTQIITESDVQRALDEFRKQGRLIKKLPDQVTPRSNLVGERHGQYEILLGMHIE